MRSSLKHLAILGLSFASLSLLGTSCPMGLKVSALLDLHASNMDKYVGDFVPATSEPSGDWIKHTFDTAAGDGPTCINNSPFTVFTRERDPSKLLIFLNGGGACWQNFYFCSITTSAAPPGPGGIFADSFDAGGGNIIDNPFADYSMMFVSYCDGSVFTGDNTVIDPAFPQGGVRHHRGLRNLTAAMDLAKAEFPDAAKVVVSGSSAGGFGVAAFAPFVFRFVFGNAPKLYVLNDSGPAVTNLANPAPILLRDMDWQNSQFIPSTCTDCTLANQPAELVEWLLQNDNQVREALYSTDGDNTIRFFLQVPTQAGYRDLLLTTHDPINAAFPFRYKRFIKSGSAAHTMLGNSTLFYTSTVNGVPIYQWADGFANAQPGWIDLVEDFIPLP